MKVRDIMTEEVETIRPDNSLAEAAQKMTELSVGVLTVKNHTDIVGVVTDRDIVVRGIARGANPETTKVQEVMTPEVIYSYEDQEIEEATEKMKQKNVRRLLVMNRSEKPVGMISLVPY